MSHEIYKDDSMFYVGEKPWHGLGVSVENALTAAEAIKAAGLDWEVIPAPVYAKYGDRFIRIEDKQGMVRSDTEYPLGVVGNVYHPLQNKEAFKFFDEIVGTGAAKYVTAGSLKHGRKIWILAEIGKEFHIGGNDLIQKYVLLYNSHDGTSMVNVMITPIRVVCWNTLNVALNNNDKRVRLRHTGTIIKRASEVKDLFGFVNKYYTDFEKQAAIFAHTPIKNDDELNRYLDRAGFVLEDDKNNTRMENIRTQIIELFDNQGMGMDMNQHSVWNAYNAVTEYIDHHRPTRSSDSFSKEEVRLDSIWFGSGANAKQKAWNAALEMITV
jgi:phage/plasmid-like protein (TIGR03299 family)